MFGVSNLAWNDDLVAKKILDKYGIKYIEVAPTKICNWKDLNAKILLDYEKKMNKKIISLQSVLYNTNLSVTNKTHSNLVQQHFETLIKICNIVKIPKIVFGSPKSRIITSEEDVITFINNFNNINSFAKKYNVLVCIEHNSKKYGCNFMTNLEETVKIIEKLNCSHIKLHIDTGNLFMEEEDILDICKYVKHIESFHISDENLGIICNENIKK